MINQEAFFAEFTADVAKHVLTIHADDGVRRHIRCRQPGTVNQAFDVLTWPGHLCYTGDMGTFVFSRIEDMFDFFRRTPRTAKSVSFQYWAEKVLAADRDGIQEFDADLFRARIKEWFADREFDSADERAEAWQAVEDEVLTYADHGHQRAVQAATEFEYHRQLLFQDFHEVRVREYTGRFMWCCYAIQWAIEAYDAAKAKARP